MRQKRKNLRQKLVPSLIAAACIPIAIFALVSQARLRKSTMENLNMQARADLQKADQSLNMTLDKYETILYDITTDEDFLNLVLASEAENDAMEADAYALRRDFSHICNRNEGVEGIQLILKDGRRIFYDRLSSSSVNSAWITKLDVPGSEALLSYFADKGQADDQPQMFHIARRIVDYWDIHNELGYVILSISMDTLATAMDTGSESEIYIAENGTVVEGGKEGVVGQKASSLETRGKSIQAIENERSGWTILLGQPMKPYQRAIREQLIFWFLVAAAMLLILVILLYRVTRPVMGSVNGIVDAMDNLEKEKFCLSLPVNEGDSSEIQRISEGFNEMAERTRLSIEQVKASAMEQKNAEIAALEAQIDPHFLYNILDTINWKAIENEQYEISQMLVALAGILRYAINDAGELTTVGDECIWIEKYVLLHQAKLGEDIELGFQVDEELKPYKIHKMLMQPFVENAVKYGFHGNKEPHRLEIKIEQAGEQLHIQIINNGTPIRPETLTELNAGVERKNHLGISNVRKRLKLYYGENIALYFESTTETNVHLFVPLQGGNEDADSSD